MLLHKNLLFQKLDTAISFGALTVSWFNGPNIMTKDDDYLDGNIGLRNYFYSGDGTSANPFEIVSPIISIIQCCNSVDNVGLF